MSKLAKRDKGFTLIEIVIVLAIAALIILVVLQAVGAAQRSNRDSTRKQEAARVVSLLEQYASNNGGKYPATTAAAVTAISTYDSALSTKYTASATVSTPTFTTNAVPSTGGCPTIDSSTYQFVYQATTNTRDYSLGACLEAGGTVPIKPL